MISHPLRAVSVQCDYGNCVVVYIAPGRRPSRPATRISRSPARAPGSPRRNPICTNSEPTIPSGFATSPFSIRWSKKARSSRLSWTSAAAYGSCGGLRYDLSRMLRTNVAGVTIGIPRNGSSARRSASPETIRSAWPLTASSRNLSSFGSRQAVIRSVIVTSSAAASSSCSQSRKRGGISGARRGRASAMNSSRSVVVDLRRRSALETV